jgi:hypothetical protein
MGMQMRIVPVISGHRVKRAEVLQTPWGQYIQWHYGGGHDCSQLQYLTECPSTTGRINFTLAGDADTILGIPNNKN